MLWACQIGASQIKAPIGSIFQKYVYAGCSLDFAQMSFAMGPNFFLHFYFLPKCTHGQPLHISH